MTADVHTTKQQRWSVRQHTKGSRGNNGRRLSCQVVCSFICVLAHRQILSRSLCWLSLAIYCESIPGSLEFQLLIFDCALLLMATRLAGETQVEEVKVSARLKPTLPIIEVCTKSAGS